MPRIVITLDTESLSHTAIDAATGLAAGLSATLDALFVEDERLLRLAALPFACETGVASAHVRRLEASGMERALLAQARQLRQALEEAAREMRFAWSFETVRGELLQIAAAQSGADLLVLGCTRRPGSAAAAERRPGRRPLAGIAARPVMAVFDDSLAGVRSLEAGHALARLAGAALVVVVREDDAGRVAGLRARAEAWLAGRTPSQASFVAIPGSDIAPVARAARQQQAAAVLLPASGPAPQAARLAELLDEIACPVVLVR